MRYLLDTCIIEALLKEEAGHENIRGRIAAAPRGSLEISALTAVEIWTGITGAREPRAKRIAFEGWLKVMRVAAIDAAAARQAFHNTKSLHGSSFLSRNDFNGCVKCALVQRVCP